MLQTIGYFCNLPIGIVGNTTFLFNIEDDTDTNPDSPGHKHEIVQQNTGSVSNHVNEEIFNLNSILSDSVENTIQAKEGKVDDIPEKDTKKRVESNEIIEMESGTKDSDFGQNEYPIEEDHEKIHQEHLDYKDIGNKSIDGSQEIIEIPVSNNSNLDSQNELNEKIDQGVERDVLENGNDSIEKELVEDQLDVVQNETIGNEIIAVKEDIERNEPEHPDDHKHLDDFVPNETKEYKEILEGKSHIQLSFYYLTHD